MSARRANLPFQIDYKTSEVLIVHLSCGLYYQNISIFIREIVFSKRLVGCSNNELGFIVKLLAAW
jgi:hypothetical protein